MNVLWRWSCGQVGRTQLSGRRLRPVSQLYCGIGVFQRPLRDSTEGARAYVDVLVAGDEGTG